MSETERAEPADETEQPDPVRHDLVAHVRRKIELGQYGSEELLRRTIQIMREREGL